MIDRKSLLHNPHTAIPAQTIHRTFAQGYRRMSTWPPHVVPFQMYVKHYIQFNHNKNPNTKDLSMRGMLCNHFVVVVLFFIYNSINDTWLVNSHNSGVVRNIISSSSLSAQKCQSVSSVCYSSAPSSSFKKLDYYYYIMRFLHPKREGDYRGDRDWPTFYLSILITNTGQD